LPVTQNEFGFTPETFNLMRESGIGGDRITHDHAKADHARHSAGSFHGLDAAQRVTPENRTAEPLTFQPFLLLLGLTLPKLLCLTFVTSFSQLSP
jgi:hypothetical protein